MRIRPRRPSESILPEIVGSELHVMDSTLIWGIVRGLNCPSGCCVGGFMMVNTLPIQANQGWLALTEYNAISILKFNSRAACQKRIQKMWNVL
jgi:hypothetical protein